MDVFVRNIPIQVSDQQLNAFFREHLQEFHIHTFNCQKLKGKGCARLTILDLNGAQVFLRIYGTPGSTLNAGIQTIRRLVLMGRPIYCSASNSRPDEFLIRTLATEERARLTKAKALEAPGGPPAERLRRTFPFSNLSVGLLGYRGHDLAFTRHYDAGRGGSVKFGHKALGILLEGETVTQHTYKLEIQYYSIDKVIVGGYSSPTVALSLKQAPKIYRLEKDSFLEMLNELSLKLSLTNRPEMNKTSRARTCALDPDHENVAGSCLVYYLTLADNREISDVQKLLINVGGMPQSIAWPLRTLHPKRTFAEDFRHLCDDLNDLDRLGTMPFALMFQMQRLAYNFFLPPATVTELLPYTVQLFNEFGKYAAVEAVRSFSRASAFPGPDTEAVQFATSTIMGQLKNYARTFKYTGSMYELADRHSHIVLVHKVHITPAGMYLHGPDNEVKNRVLRKYPEHTDYFIRVSFLDENSESVKFEPQTSLDAIYRRRFKDVVDGRIPLAGRSYTFLVFSHSSLRCQTCWFMAPFVYRRSLHHAKDVIAGLGNFVTIRSPAKCAARIGQAFSETNGTVPIQKENLRELDDIKRNGRCFTDGVGTASLQMFQRIWREYAMSRQLRPTALQIRFAGAKGMVSLDSRLQGEVLCIRESMTKFKGANALDIEICGAAFKPLPCYLNRQFIKILEDLGVPPTSFLKLQADAVESLRQITLTPVNAATFLELSYTGQGARVPSLIRLMNDIGLNFKADDFLRDTVEMAALVQLRDIKHRSRILVSEGVTLYGIADETGILNEGEIYCVTEGPKGGRSVLTGGRVVVTRAPALHCGDIQIVRAVDVPETSPLNALRNCVVFSTKGERDLASQLSGGDLDGDLYNIIYSPLLMPKHTYEPADYPRQPPLDIGRKVEREDMADFFLKFMETDQLGRICTIHQQLADQRPGGTTDPDCITLAEMASVAVDYSKTGVPVEMAKCPKYNRLRPDFMAQGPRVIIEKDIKFEDDELPHEEDVDDRFADLEPDVKPYRYYESEKVLGRLYRAIDERRFLEVLHEQARSHADGKQTLMSRLWGYIQRETLLVQYGHHRTWAKEVKEAYDNSIVDTAHDYSQQPHQPLSELEVFSGTIIGNSGGAQNKRVREINKSMKEKFDRDAAFVVDRMLYGDYEQGNNDEALERSLACLAVAMEEPVRVARRMGELKSFRYIAAAVCLKELERFQGNFGILRPL